MISVVRGRWALLAALFISAAQAQIHEKVKPCAECHSADGNSVKDGVPSIAAQPRIFLENYLVLTREGLRGSEEMRKLLSGVRDSDIVALAAHYSKLPARPPNSPIDKTLFERGRKIAANNRCGSCHGPEFRGREQMPRLAGQREDFLTEAMIAYRRNQRPGGDTMMAAALYDIPEAEFKALAHYLSRLK